jgi:DNA processing protein
MARPETVGDPTEDDGAPPGPPPAPPRPLDAPLPDEAWVVALASLDQMGPARLRALLDDHPPPEAWRRVLAGRLAADPATPLGRALGRERAGHRDGADEGAPRAGAVLARWRRQAATIDVSERWAAHVGAGVDVMIRSSPRFPAVVAGDPEPPSVLFSVGDRDALDAPRVAVVGTRDCTRYGYDVARELGAELAANGVAVVSGLALGIDGAAHAGALAADATPPVAVVGSGLDRRYPARNAPLWRRVAGAGLILSEYPLGTPPLAWHFPARNRLIVALAEVVVVVESPERGGSMLTVDCAIERGVEVMAVPGPVTAPSSAGTNGLLADGRPVVRDAADVLVALGLSAASRRSSAGGQATAPDGRTPVAPGDRPVIDALGWQPATFDQLVRRTGLSVVEMAAALHRLVTDGWIAQRGGWYERLGRTAR